MRKYLALLLTIALAVGAFASCGGTDEESADGVQVGIVLPTKEEPRWVQEEAALKTALENEGFSSETMFSQDSTATELANVSSLVEKNIKVLIICSSDVEASGAAVQKAKDAGATVVCYDRIIKGTDAVDYYVAFNPYNVGVAQGQYLIDRYAGRKDIPLYLFSGAITDDDSFDLFAGAWSVLNKAVQQGQFIIQNCPMIADYIGREFDAQKDRDALTAILGNANTNGDAGTAATLAAAALAVGQKGDVAILAPNDLTARAIADVFATDPTVTSYAVTGWGAETASLKYIQEGKQGMTVWENTTALNETICDMVSIILYGKTPMTDVKFENGAKKVPGKEVAVTVIDAAKLAELIANGDVKQEEIDAANPSAEITGQ